MGVIGDGFARTLPACSTTRAQHVPTQQHAAYIQAKALTRTHKQESTKVPKTFMQEPRIYSFAIGR